MKTFFRWPGNKSKYLTHILPLVPKDYNTYIEPFVGSGAMFLSIQPSKWIINDLNKDIFNIWNHVKNNLDKILFSFDSFQNVFVKLKPSDKLELCKKMTKSIPMLPYGFERAATFMLMSFCAFLGYIFQKSKFVLYGIDNTLYNNKNIYFFSKEFKSNIKYVNTFLNSSHGKIMNVDYKKVLSKAEKDDFVFLDPPYVESHDYKFKYNKDQNVNQAFFDDLLTQVKLLDDKNVKWMMTQADTAEVRKLFKKYKILKYPVFRIRSNQKKYELIIKNY